MYGSTRSSRARARVFALALLVGGTLAVRGAADTDADLQLQLATLLYDETRYQEALQAFDRRRRPPTRAGRSRT